MFKFGKWEWNIYKISFLSQKLQSGKWHSTILNASALLSNLCCFFILLPWTYSAVSVLCLDTLPWFCSLFYWFKLTVYKTWIWEWDFFLMNKLYIFYHFLLLICSDGVSFLNASGSTSSHSWLFVPNWPTTSYCIIMSGMIELFQVEIISSRMIKKNASKAKFLLFQMWYFVTLFKSNQSMRENTGGRGETPTGSLGSQKAEAWFNYSQ